MSPLIRLILPNAKIIDARRHPLDCCFSNFRQHFAKGQAFSYRLADMGRYYARLCPADGAYRQGAAGLRPPRDSRARCSTIPEAEVRAMLDLPRPAVRGGVPRIPLPMRARCAPRSSEQVRRPINRDGVGQWQPYDAVARPAPASARPGPRPPIPPLLPISAETGVQFVAFGQQRSDISTKRRAPPP